MHLSKREGMHVCKVKQRWKLTFNSGCSLTVVQYGQFSKSCPRKHLPQQLPILDDLQQALCSEENTFLLDACMDNLCHHKVSDSRGGEPTAFSLSIHFPAAM